MRCENSEKRPVISGQYANHSGAPRKLGAALKLAGGASQQRAAAR